MLWRLDVLRGHRAWTVRLPQLLPTRRHVVGVIVATGALAAAATCLILMTVLVTTRVANTRGQVIEGAAIVGLALAALRLLAGLSPAGVVTAYEQADLRLISRTPLGGSHLYLGRVWLAQLVPQVIVLGGAALALTVAAGLTATPAHELVPLWCVGLLWLAASGLAMAGSTALFSLILRLPPVLVGPGLFGVGLLAPLALTVLAVLVASTLVTAARDAGGLGGLPSAIMAEPLVRPVLGALDDPRGLALCAATAVLALAAPVLVARAVLPDDLYRIRARLSGGHRWRTVRPFPAHPPAATADKDLRLLLRRGIPAWQVLDDVLTLLPTLVGVGLAGEVISATSEDPFLGHLATLANAGLVVVIMGMASEALTPVLTSDSDGPTLRLLRWHPTAYRRYLAAKSGVAAVILAVIGLVSLGLVHTVAPWPNAALGAMGLTVVLAAVAEAICVVVGSAHRPALFRKDLGIADLEPSVRLASGLLTAAVVTTTGPLVVVASLWGGPISAVATGVVVAAVIPLAHVTAVHLAPAVHRNLTKGDTHASASRRRAATGV